MCIPTKTRWTRFSPCTTTIDDGCCDARLAIWTSDEEPRDKPEGYTKRNTSSCVAKDLFCGVAEKDYVRFGVAAAYQKFFAVRRPAKAGNLIGLKLGNLAPGFAIKRLQPKIVHIVFAAYGVHNRLVVRSKLRSAIGYSGNAPEFASLSRRLPEEILGRQNGEAECLPLYRPRPFRHRPTFP